MDVRVEQIEIVAFVAYLAIKLFKHSSILLRKRRWWVRELNINRKEEGFFEKNFVKLKTLDPEHFFKITRMQDRTFELFVKLISPRLEKSSIRESIDPECRIFLTLLYLSQGTPIQVLAWMFKMGFTTIRNIIYETCDIIWQELMPIYLAPPNQNEWSKIAVDFERIWNLPNCVSSIDGKHINIQCPHNAGSEYYNYKGHHSIVLLASCDANYLFTSVDVGAYGSSSDGRIFAESSLGQKLESGEVEFPPPRVLKNSNFSCKHYMVGDSAFPLKEYLMRPYPTKVSDEKSTNFNYRLSRARRVIENAFGIIVARWRILKTTLNIQPENAEKIVKASVVLHNFVKLHDSGYCRANYTDIYTDSNEIILGLWRNEIEGLESIRPSLSSNHSSKNAFSMRETLKEYLFFSKKEPNRVFNISSENNPIKRKLKTLLNKGTDNVIPTSLSTALKKVKKIDNTCDQNNGSKLTGPKIKISNDVDIEALQKLNALLQSKNSSKEIIIYKSLQHLSEFQVLETFSKCKEYLDSIYIKFKTEKICLVNRISGVNCIAVGGLVDEKVQYAMLKKLSDVYETINELPQYTDLFMVYLIPEWILLIFMMEYSVSKMEAIKQINDQEQY